MAIAEFLLFFLLLSGVIGFLVWYNRTHIRQNLSADLKETLPDLQSRAHLRDQLLEAVRLLTDVNAQDEMLPTLKATTRNDIQSFLAEYFKRTK